MGGLGHLTNPDLFWHTIVNLCKNDLELAHPLIIGHLALEQAIGNQTLTEQGCCFPREPLHSTSAETTHFNWLNLSHLKDYFSISLVAARNDFLGGEGEMRIPS